MKMKRSLVFTFAILLLITSVALVSAVTGSMGNARMILYPDVNGITNTVLDKTILVNNVNTVPLNITLVPDANASKFINVIDKSFILQPGESKKAQFEVKVRKVGSYIGQINVFFKPLNASQGGVVLSSTVIVYAAKNSGYTDNGSDTTNNNNNNNSNTNSTNIGGNTSTGLSKPVIVFGISTIVLLLILLILLGIWSKKRNKSKRKKKRY
jgi:hypothetical protein